VSQENSYILNLSHLPDGEHKFEYKLSESFFAQFDDIEFNDGNIDVEIVAEKRFSTVNLTFDINGSVNVPCDRCLEKMILDVETKEKLLVKIGENSLYEDDDVLTIDERDGELDIAWFLYEFIATSVPMQHSHADGKCDTEMMEQLNRYAVADKNDDFSKTETNRNDPRWDALKNINDNI
jgi:uncharacterized metal-binding protein YceD (DUF177 family)